MTHTPDHQTPPDDQRMTLWQTMQSVGASLFGVQSSRNRQRDFSHGKPSHFIIVGLLAVAAFIAVLVLIVQLVLRHAGL